MAGNNYKPPTEAEIAVAAAKFGTIPVPAICHKCGGLVISGVCIITIFGGIVCPVCCHAAEEEEEQNGIADLRREKERRRDLESENVR